MSLVTFITNYYFIFECIYVRFFSFFVISPILFIVFDVRSNDLLVYHGNFLFLWPFRFGLSFWFPPPCLWRPCEMIFQLLLKHVEEILFVHCHPSHSQFGSSVVSGFSLCHVQDICWQSVQVTQKLLCGKSWERIKNTSIDKKDIIFETEENFKKFWLMEFYVSECQITKEERKILLHNATINDFKEFIATLTILFLHKDWYLL